MPIKLPSHNDDPTDYITAIVVARELSIVYF